jgi:N-acetylmuramoyl-L-alanine amidase
MGVDPDEGLAFLYEVEDAPHLFLPYQPPDTTGLARRLDPLMSYIACRWDYDETPKSMLPYMVVKVTAPKTGRSYRAFPADWGPHEDTGRIADISPGLLNALGITTDDEVIVEYQAGENAMRYAAIAISSGHSTKCQGASGVLNEVEEATQVADRMAEELSVRGVRVKVFHDTISTTQNENLNRITDWHNDQDRDLDVSVHFNAYVETEKPMGTEVLYVTQGALASELSAAIASCGFIDRGGKYRDDLFVLNNTDKPAILIETCFCDSEADADVYREQFDALCDAIATVLGGPEEQIGAPERPPGEVTPPQPVPPQHVLVGHVDIEISGPVVVTVNRVPVTAPPPA